DCGAPGAWCAGSCADIHHQDGWARALLDGRDWRDAGLRYTQHIDLLPFGQLSAGERENVDQLQPTLGAIAEAVRQRCAMASSRPRSGSRPVG
ncbi:hypothetical protein FK514_29770, partial [Klebsiella pneumoniae]|uniref:cellulose synthase operon protein YhjQ/BcsQ n=1 Tax=Klebsiella pneumoniae TaxID=573 RepID=UPI00272E4B15